MKRIVRRIWTTWLPHLMFWGWNVLFFSVTAFSLVPDVLKDARRGGIPWSFGACLLVLFLIPPAAMVLGFFWRRRPGHLIRFFYGIEAPLFVLVLVRYLLLRELNPGLIFMAVAFALTMLLYGAYLVGQEVPQRAISAMWQLAGTTLVLLTGLYLAALLAFYVVPLAGLLIGWLLGGDWIDDATRFFSSLEFHKVLLATLYALLFCASVLAFLALPLALPWLYLESWRRRIAHYVEVLGRLRTLAVSGAVLAVSVGSFVLINRQPQRAVFEQLAVFEQPGAFSGTPAEKRRLLADATRNRRGLVNAYLAPYRYVSSVGESTHIRKMWQEVYGGSYGTWAGLERFFTVLARPLLYDGDSFAKDRQLASMRYTELFDAELQKAERPAILRSLEATSDRSEAQAGHLDIDARNVRLTRQELRVREAGSWAEVELYEVYVNQTFEQQEILYHFSLPETAAITGLWLGESADREARYEFVVSTRGAAQAVYQAEVRRRVDPALVEQVGPRQYRLRAFPIPPRPRSEPGAEAPTFHLWMTLRVPLTPQGWPLPRLIERRNVFWNGATARLVEGGSATDDGWLPSFIAHDGQRPRHLAATVAGHRVTARLRDAAAPSILPPGALAVVVDTSHSMTDLADELTAVMDQLEKLEGRARRDVDVYVTDSTGRPKRLDRVAEIDFENEVFFGALRPAELLAQYQELRSSKSYLAVLVLTDDGAYDLEGGGAPERPCAEPCSDPLWVVHLGGRMPVGYDDAFLAALETSGGGVASSLREALDKMSAPDGTWVADAYVWSVEDVGDTVATPSPGFEKVAARQLIRSLSRGLDTGDLDELDELHAIAGLYGVVSSYSSMIVLVSQAQHAALDKAENEVDRFEREHESGKETLTTPFNPFEVSGVPEPEEWILIVMASAVLIYLRMRRLG